jgi:LacI family transcriptional regulator
MPTIRDVAERASVSIATVSRVLNDSGYVSPELDARVRQAIAELGYQRNVLARNLRRSESRTLGMLIPNSDNPFFAEMAKGVEDFCFGKGFTVVLCNTDENAEKEESYFNTLYQQRVAGFIVVSTGRLTAHLQHLLDDGCPIVMADRRLPGLNADSVVSDNAKGAQQAVRHLIELGHRRIGLIVGYRELETMQARWAGATDTLQAAGITLEPRMVFEQGNFLPQSGYTGGEALLNQPEPPTAIFALNDLMAFGVLGYACAHGIDVPSQLSIVGFDDILLASYVAPALTTVAQPKYELGRTVAEVLLRRVQGNKESPIHLVLPTELIVRGSTTHLDKG